MTEEKRQTEREGRGREIDKEKRYPSLWLPSPAQPSSAQLKSEIRRVFAGFGHQRKCWRACSSWKVPKPQECSVCLRKPKNTFGLDAHIHLGIHFEDKEAVFTNVSYRLTAQVEFLHVSRSPFVCVLCSMLHSKLHAVPKKGHLVPPYVLYVWYICDKYVEMTIKAWLVLTFYHITLHWKVSYEWNLTGWIDWLTVFWLCFLSSDEWMNTSVRQAFYGRRQWQALFYIVFVDSKVFVVAMSTAWFCSEKQAGST